MIKSTQEDSYFSQAAAELEKELGEIFDEVDEVVKNAGALPEDFLPGLEILPDDFDESANLELEPQIFSSISGDKGVNLPLLKPPQKQAKEPSPFFDDFDSTVGCISPAATHLSAQDQDHIEFSMTNEFPATDELLSTDKLYAAGNLSNLLEKEELARNDSWDTVPLLPSTPTRTRVLRLSLSPEELSELIERAVENGVATALKQLNFKNNS